MSKVIMFIQDTDGEIWSAHYNGVQKFITLETEGACICTDLRPNTETHAINLLRENMAHLFD